MNGKQVFHDLSHKHVGYSRKEADEMYERKLRDRYTKSLGYPSCATFEREGCKQCSGCVIKGTVISPLNLKMAMLPKIAEAVAPLDRRVEPIVEDAGPAHVERPELPDGYRYGDELNLHDTPHSIYVDGGKGKGWIEILTTRVYSYQNIKGEKGGGIGLRLRTQQDGGKIGYVCITADEIVDPQSLIKTMSRGEMGVISGQGARLAHLMSSWRGRRQLAEKATRAVQYGWIYPDSDEEISEPVGFAFGGKIFQSDGTTVPSISTADDQLPEIYCVRGGLEPWFKALECILSTGGAEVQALALASFAAPLVKFTGYPSVAIMGIGDSGGMKSAAMGVGLAIWANPKLAAQKPNASMNAIMRRMGALRHLPTSCDDLQRAEFESAKKLVMQITQGADGAKLTPDRREREQGAWDTVVVTGSNNSLAEFIEQTNKNDSSALVRCFEFKVPKLRKDNPGFRGQAEVAPILAALNHNYGHVGLKYAEMLGRDPALFKNLVRGVGNTVTKKVGEVDSEERYWYTAATTIIAGAFAANRVLAELGSDLRFDKQKVEEFVIGVFFDMRERVEEAKVKSSDHKFVKKHLIAFFNDHVAANNMMLWTQSMPAGPGRPDQHQPLFPVGRKFDDMKKIAVRWVLVGRRLLISQHELYAYLRKQEISTTDMLKGLKNFYGAKVVKKINLGGGTSASPAREDVIEIRVIEGTWLDEIMYRNLTEEQLREIVPLQLQQNQDQ
jgi:hypothetical protein